MKIINNISICNILFEKNTENNEVVISGIYNKGKKEYSIDLFCNFQTLTDLLLLGGAEAEDTIIELTNRIASLEDETTINIDVEDIYEDPLVISNFKMELSKPYILDENGHIDKVKEECYCIDNLKKQ